MTYMCSGGGGGGGGGGGVHSHARTFRDISCLRNRLIRM